MLQAISEYTKTWVSWLLAIVLSLAFGLWGISYYLHDGRADTTAAEINGITIQKQDVEQAYQQLRNRFLASRQGAFTVQIETVFREQALKELLLNTLLHQALKQMGFVIGDNQIEIAIMRNPIFQINGEFSEPKFQQILSANLLSETQYVQSIKKDMMNAQIQRGFLASAFVLPETISKTHALLEQERDIQYATLNLSAIPAPSSIPEADIQAFYKAHAVNFQIPEKMSIEYIVLDLGELRDKQKISAADISEAYQNNLNNFTDGKTVKPLASVQAQIESSLKTQKAEEQFAQVKNQLANLSYANPESLAVAAKALNVSIQSSDFFSKDTGGKTPLTQEPQIRAIAFSDNVLVQGNNSEVIELPERHQAIVLRMKQHEAEKTKPLSQVKPEIIKMLTQAAQQTALAQLGQTVIQALEKGEDPNRLANRYHFQWHHQKNVSLHDSVLSPALLKTVFQIAPPSDKTLHWQLSPQGAAMTVVGVNQAHYGQALKPDDPNYAVLQEELENAQGQTYYQHFLSGLIARAKIKPTALATVLSQ